MNIEIEGKKENPLLERIEVRFSVQHDGEGTPTRDDLKAQLAGVLGADQKTVIIDNVKTEFGHQKSVGYAKVYRSVESVKRLEKEYLITRNKLDTEGAKG